MGLHATPWTSRDGIRLIGVPKAKRVLDCLDICWQTRRQQLGKQHPPDVVKQGLWGNPSQSVLRVPISAGKPPLLCQKTIPYSYEHDQCLSGRDFLSLQGMPQSPLISPVTQLADAELRSLGGEAYFLPSAMSVLTAYYLNPLGPWWTDVAKGLDGA